VHHHIRQGGYVLVGVSLFVCSLFVTRIMQQLLDQFSKKNGGKLACGAQKKPLLVDGTLGLGGPRYTALRLTRFS